MNFLNQNTPFPAHPVCAPSWYSPHRAPCRPPRPTMQVPLPLGMSSPCAPVSTEAMWMLCFPRSCSGMFPGRGVWDRREGGQTGCWG